MITTSLLPAIAVAVALGTAMGIFYGVLPGIGGRVGLILSIPVATLFEPAVAAIFLFALHAVVHTGTSIPAIAFGLPSTSADVATTLDGYPLAKMGRAGEALGASLSASALGGVIGALAFLAAIPVARPLVTSFGPPEFLLLALFGLTMVASLSREGLLPGLAVGCLGVLAAMVGNSPAAGDPRFTFGLIDLWDGLELPALVCGLFVIPEMLARDQHRDPEAQRRAVTTSMGDVFRGMLVTLRHMRVTLRSSLYGIVIGIMPAVGSSVSVWLSYGYAAQTTKSDIPFGQGAIAGVIAPEAANNSKEGGAMVPTLLFAIPGSTSMAIMMGALAYVGVAVGPNLLGPQIELSYALAATVLVANLLAIPAFFAVVPHLVRLASVRRDALAPIAITLSVMSALIAAPRLSTVATIAVATVVGLVLKGGGWPRAPLILGLVIGRLGERSFHQTAGIWGWEALQRPLTIALLAALAGWLVYVLRSRPVASLPGSPAGIRLIAAFLSLAFAGAIWSSVGLPPMSGTVPLVVSTAGLLLCLTIAVGSRGASGGGAVSRFDHLPLLAGYLALVPLLGLIAASFVFVALIVRIAGARLRHALITAAGLAAAQLVLLTLLFDVVIEREIVGRLAWFLLGF